MTHETALDQLAKEIASKHNEAASLRSRPDRKPDATDTDFGGEYRSLARQRRFAIEDARELVRNSGNRSLSATPASASLSQNTLNLLSQMSTLADRVVTAKEEAAREKQRADLAEQKLEFLNDRVSEAIALVKDAQAAALTAAERASVIEGRCEALQDALDMALNSSVLQRWRWRRQARRGFSKKLKH